MYACVSSGGGSLVRIDICCDIRFLIICICFVSSIAKMVDWRWLRHPPCTISIGKYGEVQMMFLSIYRFARARCPSQSVDCDVKHFTTSDVFGVSGYLTVLSMNKASQMHASKWCYTYNVVCGVQSQPSLYPSIYMVYLHRQRLNGYKRRDPYLSPDIRTTFSPFFCCKLCNRNDNRTSYVF